MSALTSNSAARRYGVGAPTLLTLDCAAATKIFAGALVMKDTSGNAVNGTATVTLLPVGIARKECDNTSGAAGAKKVEVEGGVFGFQNSAAGDAITKADLYKDCFVVDNQTVAKTDNTGVRPRAGKIVHLEGGLVFVHVNGAL